MVPIALDVQITTPAGTNDRELLLWSGQAGRYPCRLNLSRHGFRRRERSRIDLKRGLVWWCLLKFDFLADSGDRIADFANHAMKILGRNAEPFGPDAALHGVGQIDLVAHRLWLGAAHPTLPGPCTGWRKAPRPTAEATERFGKSSWLTAWVFEAEGAEFGFAELKNTGTLVDHSG